MLKLKALGDAQEQSDFVLKLLCLPGVVLSMYVDVRHHNNTKHHNKWKVVFVF